MNPPLRVLLVNLWEGPGHGYYSGPLATALARRGDVALGFLINGSQDRAPYQGKIDFLPVRAPTGLSPAQTGRLLLQPLEFLRALAAIDRFRPDVVHFVFTYPWFSATMPLLARRWPVAATWHDITPHHGEETLRNRLGIRSIVGHSRAIFVHGEQALRAAAEAAPFAQGRLVSIPFGHSDFVGEGADRSRRPEPATFLFFGRLLPYKGLGVALAALELLAARRPEARLIIAGEGSLAAERARIGRMQGRIEIVNRVISNAELQEFGLRSTAVLAPYTHASGSGVAAAAAALARPLIASRLGGLVDMVDHGETGLLFEPGNAEALAAAMERSIAEPDRMIEMGRAARERMLKVGDWDAIAETIVGAYRRLVVKNVGEA